MDPSYAQTRMDVPEGKQSTWKSLPVPSLRLKPFPATPLHKQYRPRQYTAVPDRLGKTHSTHPLLSEGRYFWYWQFPESVLQFLLLLNV